MDCWLKARLQNHPKRFQLGQAKTNGPHDNDDAKGDPFDIGCGK